MKTTRRLIKLALGLQVGRRLALILEIQVIVDGLEQVPQPGIVHERVAKLELLLFGEFGKHFDDLGYCQLGHSCLILPAYSLGL